MICDFYTLFQLERKNVKKGNKNKEVSEEDSQREREKKREHELELKLKFNQDTSVVVEKSDFTPIGNFRRLSGSSSLTHI